MKKHELLEKAMRDYPKGTVAVHEGTTAEHTSTGLFKIKEDGYNGVCVLSDTDTECFYSENTQGEYGPTWAIPIKESILSGKVAIQVNNEREFKLLMEHYESKGWRWVTNESPYFDGVLRRMKFPEVIRYCDKFSHQDAPHWECSETTVIPFSDFAAEIGIEVPVFVMTSEDGVPLYKGDKYSHAYYSDMSHQWMLGVSKKGLEKDCLGVTKPKEVKVFSNIANAEKWCDEQNKQKEVVLKLDGATVTVTNDKINIKMTTSGLNYWFEPNDLEAMYKAYKSLQ